MTSLALFRLDLRIHDNPALAWAARNDSAVIPVFVWDPAAEGEWAPGAASRWWLHHALASLDVDLRKRGSRLVLRVGDTTAELLALAKQSGATRVCWNRRYTPNTRKADEAMKSAFDEAGLEVRSCKGALLLEPWENLNKQEKPYRVFTPFYNNYPPAASLRKPERAPSTLNAPGRWPASVKLAELGLLPSIRWDKGLQADWDCGEQAARSRMKRFINAGLAAYANDRDLPGIDGVSRLSPHLHFGQISAITLAQAVERAVTAGRAPRAKAQAWIRQLVWREFGHHLLFHFPDTPQRPTDKRFLRFPWRRSARDLRAWQRGRTGYPFVDAGMRELWTTGWMHNRARMVAASFLVKHLLIDWREGAHWFWDTLVDADLANNTMGWQWVAGCGADAAPYFRIFNPVSQGEKFDKRGEYVRRWIPELAGLPDKWIHKPWAAPAEVLRAAGVRLGNTYPRPLVEHAAARQRALDAFATLRGNL